MTATHRSSMNNELFFNLFLPHLSVDVVYRLYPFSSILRRMVDQRHYWIQLIERDLKMVPQFEINPKLHYLRLMNYPIAGSLLNTDKQHPSTTEKVVQFLDGVILYRNNKIEYKGKIIYLPEPIKFLRSIFRCYYAIAYSGKVYTLSCSQHLVALVDTDGIDVLDMITISDVYGLIAVITHKGELKVLIHKINLDNILKTCIDLTKQLDSKAIQLHNYYVMTEKGDMHILDSEYINTIRNSEMQLCRALLPSPYVYNCTIRIGTRMLSGEVGTRSIYDPTNGFFYLQKCNSTIFVDPLGEDLLSWSFDRPLEDYQPILEICASKNPYLILRTI